MPPSTTPLRALRAIPRIYSTAPLSLRAPSRQFIPKATSLPPSTRTFSAFHRKYSTESSPTEKKPLYESAEDQPATPPRPDVPSYQITFTCKPCETRSSHKISKQGYHKGSVLITCPECRNRHIISDHLNIFGDKALTIEDLMRERGQLVKRGTLSEDGDVEFWEDGTTTPHEKADGTSRNSKSAELE